MIAVAGGKERDPPVGTVRMSGHMGGVDHDT